MVNGAEVLIKGANRVPLDACHGRDAGRLGETFAMLVDRSCNMIRCWGGNVCETVRPVQQDAWVMLDGPVAGGQEVAVNDSLDSVRAEVIVRCGGRALLHQEISIPANGHTSSGVIP